jgi:hypothetical protein
MNKIDIGKALENPNVAKALSEFTVEMMNNSEITEYLKGIINGNEELGSSSTKLIEAITDYKTKPVRITIAPVPVPVPVAPRTVVTAGNMSWGPDVREAERVVRAAAATGEVWAADLLKVLKAAEAEMIQAEAAETEARAVMSAQRTGKPLDPNTSQAVRDATAKSYEARYRLNKIIGTIYMKNNTNAKTLKKGGRITTKANYYRKHIRTN